MNRFHFKFMKRRRLLEQTKPSFTCLQEFENATKTKVWTVDKKWTAKGYYSGVLVVSENPPGSGLVSSIRSHTMETTPQKTGAAKTISDQ